MIKVINLISLLFSGAILAVRDIWLVQIPNTDFKIPGLAAILSVILIVIVGYAIMYSKRETKEEAQRSADDEPKK
jgi:membrane protein implicated in regulation of membrane protease activity